MMEVRVQWIVKYLYTSGKLWGIFPLVYNVRTNSVKVSRKAFCYCSAVAVIIITMTAYLVFCQITSTHRLYEKVKIYPALSLQGHIVQYLAIVISYFTQIWNTTAFKDILNEALRLHQDIVYKSLNQPCDRKLQHHMLFQLSLILSATTLSLLYFPLTSALQDLFNRLMLGYYLMLIIHMIDIIFTQLYISGMLFAAHLYRNINETLSILINQFQRHTRVTAMNSCELSDEIDELSILHSRVFHFTQKWHSIFSKHLLLMHLKVCLVFMIQVYSV